MPSPVASAQRRDPQLAQSVAQAVSVGCDQVDQVATRSTTWSSGSGGSEPGGWHDREVQPRRAGLRARPGAGAGPAIEPDLDDVDPPVEELGERDRDSTQRATRVIGGQREIDRGARGDRRHRVRRGRPVRPARDRADRPRRQTPRARPPIPPARTTGISGRRCAAAATSAPSSPSARRSSAAGGTAPRPGSRPRPGRGAASTSGGDRSSPRSPPMCANRSATQQRRAVPAHARIRRPRPAFGPDARDLDPGQFIDARFVQPERRAQTGIRGNRPCDEQRRERVPIRPGRQHQRPDQPPTTADPPDQRRRDRRATVSRVRNARGSLLTASCYRATARYRGAQSRHAIVRRWDVRAEGASEHGSERTRSA